MAVAAKPPIPRHKAAPLAALFLSVLLVAPACISAPIGGTAYAASAASEAGDAPEQVGQALVLLARPGPWPAVSGLAVFDRRLWLANSNPYVNFNAADLYSLRSGQSLPRYERALFSQSVGKPLLDRGRLYWPFEDSRFSNREAEYVVTDGESWRWRQVPGVEAFHLHAMTRCGGALHAVTSAWEGALQRWEEETDRLPAGWRELYRHPTPSGRVSRFTEIVDFRGQCLLGLTAQRLPGAKLLRWTGAAMEPVPGWPEGRSVTGLTRYRDALYGINATADTAVVLRYDGAEVRPVAFVEDERPRGLRAALGRLWAFSAVGGEGRLRVLEADGSWRLVRAFSGEIPIDLTAVGPALFVGTHRPNGQGGLWGPPPNRQPSRYAPENKIRLQPRQVTREPGLEVQLARLDEALRDPDLVQNHALRLRESLQPFARMTDPRAGVALAARLAAPIQGQNRAESLMPATTFADIPVTHDGMAHWFLLRAMGLNGHGQVPLELLEAPWRQPPNRPEKHFEPLPAALWVLPWVGQNDPQTLALLIERLRRGADPDWLTGDVIGALSALTGQFLGWHPDDWIDWWDRENHR